MTENTQKKIKAKCLVCGKEFYKNSSTHKYCSNACIQVATHYGKSSKVIIKTCSVCGKKFTTNRNNRKNCSNECTKQYNLNQYTKGTTYKKECVICGAEFRTGNKDTKTCNPECASELIGRNNKKPKKKSNKTKINKNNYDDMVSFTVKELIRIGTEGRDNCGISFNYNSTGFTSTLKEQVKDRDNYTCRVCGNKHRLEVHHIVKIKHGGENSLDNLVTLCVQCHRAIDTLDLDHALKKCKKNAEKYLGIENTPDYRTTKEKVEDMGFDLRAIYSKLKRKGDDPDIQDILVLFNNVLDDVESISGL